MTASNNENKVGKRLTSYGNAYDNTEAFLRSQIGGNTPIPSKFRDYLTLGGDEEQFLNSILDEVGGSENAEKMLEKCRWLASILIRFGD